MDMLEHLTHIEMQKQRQLDRIEQKVDKIMTKLMIDSEPSLKTPEQWKKEKQPCPNWWSQNPMNPQDEPKIPY